MLKNVFILMSVICIILMSISVEKGMTKMDVKPIKSASKKHEEVTRILVRSYPLDSIDQLLSNIWKSTKSKDQKKGGIAWESLYTIWRFSDGMKCHFFTRFCWFRCKDEPLTFYLRYLTGDKRAFEYYELASMYDISTFKEDRITKREFIDVLELVKDEIENYNKKNLIKDESSLRMIIDYVTKARKRIKN